MADLNTQPGTIRVANLDFQSEAPAFGKNSEDELRFSTFAKKAEHVYQAGAATTLQSAVGVQQTIKGDSFQSSIMAGTLIFKGRVYKTRIATQSLAYDSSRGTVHPYYAAVAFAKFQDTEFLVSQASLAGEAMGYAANRLIDQIIIDAIWSETVPTENRIDKDYAKAAIGGGVPAGMEAAYTYEKIVHVLELMDDKNIPSDDGSTHAIAPFAARSQYLGAKRNINMDYVDSAVATKRTMQRNLDSTLGITNHFISQRKEGGIAKYNKTKGDASVRMFRKPDVVLGYAHNLINQSFEHHMTQTNVQVANVKLGASVKQKIAMYDVKFDETLIVSQI